MITDESTGPRAAPACAAEVTVESLQRELALRDRVVEAAISLGQAVSLELDLDVLCDVVVDNLAEVFRVETLALLFRDEGSEELYVKRRRGAHEPQNQDGRFVAERDVADTALAEQRAVCLRNSDPDQRDTARTKTFPPPNSMVAVPLKFDASTVHMLAESRAAAAVPLMAERKVKGVLALTWPPDEERPTPQDLRMLEGLASQVAAAIDNAWLYSELKQFNARLEQKVRDRTAELDESNQQLSQTLDELKQTQTQLVQNEKMASLGQLTAGIAHEINNPLAYSISNIALAKDRLAAIERYAQLLTTRADMAAQTDPDDQVRLAVRFIDSLADDPRYREDALAFRADLSATPSHTQPDLVREFLRYVSAREAHESSLPEAVASLERLLDRGGEGLHRVKNIVLDLRSFSRLDEAQFQLASIDDGIAGTASIVTHLAKERRVQLEHHRGISESYACFPAKLNQVILNLLTNALQATEPGGTVTVSTSEQAGGPRIEVRDSGCGIPEAHLSKVFDPFFTTKPVGHGTGLGLSISYKIIEEHKGKIQVTSTVGSGTCFTIDLPRHPTRTKE